jgi:hypothetical protein
MECDSLFWSRCFLVVTMLVAASLAQPPVSLPGCEPTPEVRKALEEIPDGKDLAKMKFSDWVARRHAAYQELIAKYPREVEPYRRLIEEENGETRGRDGFLDPSPYPALPEKLRAQAAQNPDDPLALYLAGLVLFEIDTPESFRLLEVAKAKAPQVPWPSLALAKNYSSGKRSDKQKSSDNLAAFFALCPDSTDGSAQWLLGKDTRLQPGVAAALRTRLSQETDPERLKEYGTLWSLEFRLHPPQEHDVLRRQIAEDLKRIETLNPRPDSEWQSFLISGYKQAGASSETVTAMEDRLLHEYPHSNGAFDIVAGRWHKANKAPEDQKDVVAWAKYRAAHTAARKGWIRDFPNDPQFAHGEWFLDSDKDDSLSEKDGIAAMDEFLNHTTVFGSPGSWIQFYAADFLLKHKWQPSRALDLLEKTKTIDDRVHAQQRANDDLSAEEREDLNERQVAWDLRLDGQILKAAQLAEQPDAVMAIKRFVEGPPPAQEKLRSDYWRNRARLAVIESRKQDALAYYQLSLRTRLEPPQYSHGKFSDDLTDEAQTLWKQTGGTPAAWATWNNLAASK